MSNIVKFFVATRVDALAALEVGPDGSLSAISFGNFDAEEALLDWEAQLTGHSFDSLVDDDVPEILAEVEEGPAVFLLSDALLSSLVSASSSQIDDLARWWVDEKADEGAEIDLPVASDILRQLVDLVRQERGADEYVYCWTG